VGDRRQIIHGDHEARRGDGYPLLAAVALQMSIAGIWLIVALAWFVAILVVASTIESNDDGTDRPHIDCLICIAVAASLLWPLLVITMIWTMEKKT
jgi:hypothetical protein